MTTIVFLAGTELPLYEILSIGPQNPLPAVNSSNREKTNLLCGVRVYLHNLRGLRKDANLDLVLLILHDHDG